MNLDKIKAYNRIMSNNKGNKYLFRRNIVIVNINKKKKYYNFDNESFKESLIKFIGQTITIYTTSGGLSGHGFTGVLLQVSADQIKLLTKLESAPIVSFKDTFSHEEEDEASLGSITNIPINKIAAFTHNII
jgi:ABC-type sulfate transport system substrate-binding protein